MLWLDVPNDIELVHRFQYYIGLYMAYLADIGFSGLIGALRFPFGMLSQHLSINHQGGDRIPAPADN